MNSTRSLFRQRSMKSWRHWRAEKLRSDHPLTSGSIFHCSHHPRQIRPPAPSRHFRGGTLRPQTSGTFSTRTDSTLWPRSQAHRPAPARKASGRAVYRGEATGPRGCQAVPGPEAARLEARHHLRFRFQPGPLSVGAGIAGDELMRQASTPPGYILRYLKGDGRRFQNRASGQTP